METVPARHDTVAAFHTSTGIIAMSGSLGSCYERGACQVPLPAWLGNPKLKPWYHFCHRRNHGEQTIARHTERLYVCAHGQGRGTATRIRIQTQEIPNRRWSTTVPSAQHVESSLSPILARVGRRSQMCNRGLVDLATTQGDPRGRAHPGMCLFLLLTRRGS